MKNIFIANLQSIYSPSLGAVNGYIFIESILDKLIEKIKYYNISDNIMIYKGSKEPYNIHVKTINDYVMNKQPDLVLLLGINDDIDKKYSGAALYTTNRFEYEECIKIRSLNNISGIDTDIGDSSIFNLNDYSYISDGRIVIYNVCNNNITDIDSINIDDICINILKSITDQINDGFISDSFGNLKYMKDGEYISNQFIKIYSNYYFFDIDGFLKFGRFKYMDKYYWSDSIDGKVYNNRWIHDRGRFYYVDNNGELILPNDNEAFKEYTVDGIIYRFSANGYDASFIDIGIDRVLFPVDFIKDVDGYYYPTAIGTSGIMMRENLWG